LGKGIACPFIWQSQGNVTKPSKSSANYKSESAHRYVPSSGFAIVYALLAKKTKPLSGWKKMLRAYSGPALFSVNLYSMTWRDDPRLLI